LSQNGRWKTKEEFAARRRGPLSSANGGLGSGHIVPCTEECRNSPPNQTTAKKIEKKISKQNHYFGAKSTGTNDLIFHQLRRTNMKIIRAFIPTQGESI